MSKLLPPDLVRCQGMHTNDVNFMTCGGLRKMVRCEHQPQFIAYERVAGPDGKKGSMSLCDECLAAFDENVGVDDYEFAEIEEIEEIEEAAE